MTEHMTGLLIGAAIAFAFVALVVIGHTLITRYLFKAALEREEPPTMKFIRRRIMDSPSVRQE